MSVTSPEPGKWEIVTPKGRKMIVEAPYITEAEVKLISSLADMLADEMEDIITGYEIEFTIDIKTGKGVGSFKKKKKS